MNKPILNTLVTNAAIIPGRFMFWTDWGQTAKIEQSFMDGSERRTIISSDLSQPSGITVDYVSERIYWSDSDLDKIEYSNYDGTERMTLETEDSGLLYPFALTVADEVLFWSDWATNTLYATHKEHGAETNEGYFASIAVFTSIPYGIEAIYPDRQQTGMPYLDIFDYIKSIIEGEGKKRNAVHHSHATEGLILIYSSSILCVVIAAFWHHVTKHLIISVAGLSPHVENV